MRSPVAILPALLAAALLAALPAARAAAAGNAATSYRRAFERLEQLGEADWEAIAAWNADPTGTPPPALREALARAAPMVDLLRRGSRHEISDYELDWTQGFALLLPHLSPMRRIVRAVQADALLRLHDGDAAGAADRIAALYRISEHLGQDGTLISSLVGQSIYVAADAAAATGFDRAALRASDCEILLAAARRFDPADPFNVVEAVAAEQAIAVDWLARKFGREEDRLRLFEEAGWLSESEDDALCLAEMTDEEFAGELSRYDRLMDGVVGAFAAGDREAGRALLDALGAEVAAEEHGLLARMMTPALVNVFDRMHEARDAVRARTAMLEELATGRVAPEARANAAVYYARAIAMLERTEPARLARAWAFEAAPEVAPSEEVLAFLEESGAIVDMVREGSLKARCDFAFLRPGPGPHALPAYAPGMWELARLLRADALRLFRAERSEEGTDRLAIAHRLTAHLGDDPPLLSSVIAHRVFERTDRITRDALDADFMGEAQREALLGAARQIARKDPFGYIESVKSAREELTGWILGKVRAAADPEASAPGTETPLAAVAAEVESWDGDRLFHAIVVIDPGAGPDAPGAGAGAGGEAAAGRDPFARLADVVDPDELEVVRGEAAGVAALLARGDLAAIEAPVVAPARIRERMAAARSALRAGLNALRDEAGAGGEGGAPGAPREGGAPGHGGRRN